ncbi:MAG: hypothetical protein RL549_1031, partial [Verrucomicrobiota bacterium]
MAGREKAKIMSVLLVLPVFNGLKDVSRVCRSIRTLQAKNRNVSVIVVDDGSSDGTPEAFRRGLKGL